MQLWNKVFFFFLEDTKSTTHKRKNIDQLYLIKTKHCSSKDTIKENKNGTDWEKCVLYFFDKGNVSITLN